MPLIKKDKATEYREAFVEKRAKSRLFSDEDEEKPKKKTREAPAAQEADAPRSLKLNKAILLLGLIPIGIAIMFGARAWPKHAAEEQRHRTVCSRNLLAIHGIKEQVSDELRLSNGEEIPDGVADGIILCGMNLCPANGQITIGIIGDEPRCSIHGTPSNRSEPLGSTP